MSATITEKSKLSGYGMPVQPGKIREQSIYILRDSGSSTVVVKRNFVRNEESTGRIRSVCLVDGSIRRFPEAQITVHNSHFSVRVTELCMDNPLYDLSLGNIPGVKILYDPTDRVKEPVDKSRKGR